MPCGGLVARVGGRGEQNYGPVVGDGLLDLSLERRRRLVCFPEADPGVEVVLLPSDVERTVVRLDRKPPPILNVTRFAQSAREGDVAGGSGRRRVSGAPLSRVAMRRTPRRRRAGCSGSRRGTRRRERALPHSDSELMVDGSE